MSLWEYFSGGPLVHVGPRANETEGEEVKSPELDEIDPWRVVAAVAIFLLLLGVVAVVSWW